MLCDICKQNEATNHYKKIVNDKISEAHLCNECAKTHGLPSPLTGLSFDFGNLLSGFFDLPQLGNPQSKAELPKCPACSTDFAQIAKTGRVGCAQCYDVFDEQLLPSIRRIHGDTMHLGKLPKSAGKQARVKAELISLKEELQEAIRVQEFEKAAELRDKINGLEGGAENA